MRARERHEVKGVSDTTAGHFIADMTWDEVAERIANGATAILPVGSAAKQHGLHLPMNTDQVQAEWLAARLADDIDAVIWPTVTYGSYPAFVAYAGSSSLSEQTFEALIRELADGILRFGCRRLLVLDTGISTLAPIAVALRHCNPRQVAHLRIHDGPHYRRVARDIAEQAHGSHADELETSIMLALAPERVDMARAEASPRLAHATPGPLTPTDSASANYSRSGSFGDPTLATRVKGEQLLAAMIEDILGVAIGASTQVAR
jgi:creatinine amidohydrolase